MWKASLFRWADRYFAYSVELIAATFLLIAEFFLLYDLLEQPWEQWLYRCLWAFLPTTRFPLESVSTGWFVDMWVVVLALLLLPAVAFYVGRTGYSNILIWSHYPQQQTLLLLEQERARLAYLRIRAQEETRRLTYLNQRALLPQDPSQLPVISKYTGWWSFYYTTLSNYLRIPEDEALLEEQIEAEITHLQAQIRPPEAPALTEPQQENEADDDTEEGEAEPLSGDQEESGAGDVAQEEEEDSTDSQESDTSPAHEEDVSDPVVSDTTTPYAQIFLFGGVRMQILGATIVQVVLQSLRVRELLAYFALPARQRAQTIDAIVNAIHEEHGFQEGKEEMSADGDLLAKNRNAFAYDVKSLRASLREAAKEAGRAYLDPIRASHGKHATHCLIEAYQVVDVPQVEALAAQVERIKEGEDQPSDLHAFRNTYKHILSLYGVDGLLGEQVREYAAEWGQRYYLYYRDLYARTLLGLADYEKGLAANQQGEERQASLRQAATLYKRYALFTAPSEDELEQGSSTEWSEYALRQSMFLYKIRGQRSEAHRLYYRYTKLMKDISPEWEPSPQTVQTYQEIMQPRAGQRRPAEQAEEQQETA